MDFDASGEAAGAYRDIGVSPLSGREGCGRPVGAGLGLHLKVSWGFAPHGELLFSASLRGTIKSKNRAEQGESKTRHLLDCLAPKGA